MKQILQHLKSGEMENATETCLQASMSNGISQLNLCDFVVDKEYFQVYSYIIHLRSTL
jgi:hypothetical protein